MLCITSSEIFGARQRQCRDGSHVTRALRRCFLCTRLTALDVLTHATSQIRGSVRSAIPLVSEPGRPNHDNDMMSSHVRSASRVTSRGRRLATLGVRTRPTSRGPHPAPPPHALCLSRWLGAKPRQTTLGGTPPGRAIARRSEIDVSRHVADVHANIYFASAYHERSRRSSAQERVGVSDRDMTPQTVFWDTLDAV